ncbi:MAG: hypothetical protein CMJ31_11060 [Phycisphaerae bacterium]|nr:hypothetical protein [Phycisphaerae bacterium]
MTGLRADSASCNGRIDHGLRGVRVVWLVGRRALAAAMPGVIEDPSDPRPVELVVELSGLGESGSIDVRLRDDSGLDRELPAFDGRASWRLEGERGLAHADVPGELSVSFRWPSEVNGRTVVPHLYASSALPERLGLLGGRYRVDRVEAIVDG